MASCFGLAWRYLKKYENCAALEDLGHVAWKHFLISGMLMSTQRDEW